MEPAQVLLDLSANKILIGAYMERTRPSTAKGAISRWIPGKATRTPREITNCLNSCSLQRFLSVVIPWANPAIVGRLRRIQGTPRVIFTTLVSMTRRHQVFLSFLTLISFTQSTSSSIMFFSKLPTTHSPALISNRKASSYPKQGCFKWRTAVQARCYTYRCQWEKCCHTRTSQWRGSGGKGCKLLECRVIGLQHIEAHSLTLLLSRDLHHWLSEAISNQSVTLVPRSSKIDWWQRVVGHTGLAGRASERMGHQNKSVARIQALSLVAKP